MRRTKPPQNHTAVTRGNGPIEMRPIGVVRSPYKERFGTPRQPTVTAQALEDRALEAEIHIFDNDDYERALTGLAGFDYIWLIYAFHLNHGWSALVTPPRGPKAKQGLFATRSPHRPNPIGLSALRLLGIEGRVLRVLGHDMLDGTPVLDIKPYVPYADAFPQARAGWLDAIVEPPTGPDRYERPS